MIFILYRIKSKISVILMGETSCIKSALIKTLNQLLINRKDILVQINIDPCYNDEKLTKNTDEINKEAERK